MRLMRHERANGKPAALAGALDALRSSIPWITLSATVALTLAGWIGMERNRMDEARAQFDRQTLTAESELRSRLASYEQMTRSAAAYAAAASPDLSRKGWHDFIAELQLDERFPGVQAIGFAERVPAAERAKHVKRRRAAGVADYAIAPAGERAQYFPIALSEPPGARDARGVGFDIYSEPVRRGAMERARDTGEAAITPRILLSAGKMPDAFFEPGFILYMPAFRAEAHPVSAEARANALLGFVCAILRAPEILRSVLDQGGMQMLDMRVADAATDRANAELFDSRAPDAETHRPAPAFSRHVAIPFGGHVWNVVFSSRPEYDQLVAARRPWALLGSGLLASFLLFVLTLTLVATWNRAHHLSMRDPLTGLYNRRYLDETIGRELPRARRQGESVGVIAVDIDHFKRLNDTFGHDAGDFVLRMLAEHLRAATRDSDIACRFGGEEFAIILPGATLEVTRARAEALRAAVEALRLEFGGQPLGHLTISAGVASMPPHAQDWNFTLQTADRALYAAKDQGRNRVVAAT